MTTLREAAQQALEAMESVEWYGAGSGWMVDAAAIEGAITALRAALAEPPDSTKPVAEFEPVACEWPSCGCRVDLGEDWKACRPEAAPLRPLNLNDPAVQKCLAAQWGYVMAEPLTDEVIERNWELLYDETGNIPDYHDFARAIERAHGIGDNK